jgi:hypothetical protein
MKAALRLIRREEVEDGRARVPDRGVEAGALWRESGRVGGLGREGRGNGVGGAVGFAEVAAFDVWLELEGGD